jgi:hypothetical protein
MAKVNVWRDGEIVRIDERVLNLPTGSGLPSLVSTKLSKAELWRRCTDEEAESLAFALSQAPFRLRLIFEAAQYLDTTDADYPALRAGVVAAVGEARADELLKPEA